MDIRKYYKKRKQGIFKIFTLLVIFIASVIIPIIIYLNVLNLSNTIDMDSYLDRLESSVFFLIIIGVLIIISKSIAYLIKPISLIKLGFSLLTGILFIIYIIISANAEIVELSVSWFYLRIDYSIFCLLLIPIPVIAINRNIITFIYKYRHVRSKLVILDIITKNSISSKKQITKFILKNKEIKPIIKRHILKNLKEFINELGTQDPQHLTVRQNKYKVSPTGHNFLKHYGIKSFEKGESLNTLEVWTEAELENFALKRGIKIRKKR
jgi:hypothetical protein